ncbi:heterokaryon incompatibility protein-domain-containing protein [Paraphoma chrysanthemicola]|uniref:Heterokaryon incompatibility protein-domain-containing protein n=1 Tax=Paraphoma chrysanthemicola TaxID=798071 RepID=A0A8K0RI88_9PLEO|nr:heterokaryon incompatibility protein-domain-containing protein [Paraphoma chrysanthemicola]
MEPFANELELIINEHRCSHCFGTDSRSLRQLYRGAEDGCAFFSIGVAVVDWAVSSEGLLGYTRDEIRTVWLETFKSQIHFYFDVSKHDNDNCPIVYQVKAGVDSVFERPIVGPNKLLASTRSEATFDIIKAWIEECAQTHVRCKHNMIDRSQNALQNVRFLEIQDQRVLLREGIVPEKYACLSHCWGTGQEIYKTRDDTVSVHSKSGILTELLPTTFQDAVEACQRLAIRYLWIDSLCIIQDNTQDWNDQASNMADIYENAYITIAASQASDPTKGCFIENSLSIIGVPLLGHRDIYVRKEPDLVSSLQDDSLWPLLSRAWAFQELSLSPRTIHFGPKEIIWHCQRKWEDQSASMTSVSGVSVNSYPFCDGLWVPKFANEVNTNLQGSWYKIVSGYSRKKLTFCTDRLSAIAAMASRMRKMRSSDRYLAGLWETTLVHDLLWSTVGSYHLRAPDHVIRERIAVMEEAERLPTWSWASAHEGVFWIESEQEILEGVRIKEIKYATRSADILGKVTEGKIVIKAPMCELDSLAKLPNGQKWFDLASPEAEGINLTSTELTVQDFQWDDCGSCDQMPTISDIHVMFVTAPKAGSKESLMPAKALLLKETACEGHWARVGVCTASLAAFFYYYRSLEQPENKPGEIGLGSRPVYQECGVSLRAKLEAIPSQTITLI